MVWTNSDASAASTQVAPVKTRTAGNALHVSKAGIMLVLNAHPKEEVAASMRNRGGVSEF